MSRRTRGQLVSRKCHDGCVRWSARYVDAAGKRTQETIGYDLTAKEAREKLDDLLHGVRTQHRKAQKPITLERFAREWIAARDEEEGQSGALKRSTRAGYRLIIENHLVPALGRKQLAAIDVDELESYIATKRKKGLGPRTINRHLNLMHRLFVVAEKRGLARANPVRLVERPREPRRRWRILTPTRDRQGRARIRRAQRRPLDTAGACHLPHRPRSRPASRRDPRASVG